MNRQQEKSKVINESILFNQYPECENEYCEYDYYEDLDETAHNFILSNIDYDEFDFEPNERIEDATCSIYFKAFTN